LQEPKTLLKYPEHPSQISFPAFKTEGEKPKNPVEKFLSLFADVRAGEGLSALLMGLNVFLLLFGYYLLKTVREPLVLIQAGAKIEAYLAGAQAVLLVGIIPLYGWIGSRVNRLRLVAGANLFFASNLVIFSAVGNYGVRIGVVFYVWVGIFNVFIISQFWAFANDIYTEGQGRRLFPMIGVGSSLGAVAGARLAAVLFHSHSAYELMLLCAIALLVSIAIVCAVNRREIRRGGAAAAREAAEPLGSEGAFQLLARDRYLFWIAILVVTLNIVNANGEYVIRQLLENDSIARFGVGAASDALRSRYLGVQMGNYQAWYNAVALVVQLLLVSRIMRHAGVRAALFILPCISLAGYSTAALVPALVLVRVMKVAENSVDYSLQNTANRALFLPTSREAKYKAQAAVEAFCKRFGDVISSGLVFMVARLGAGPRTMCVLSVALAVAWLWAATRIAKEHRKRTI
jgi:AAA family ATP:ADP antiporter